MAQRMPPFEKVTFGIRPEESKVISCWNLREGPSRQKEEETERFETGAHLVNWRPTRDKSGHQEVQNKVLMILEKSGKPKEALLAVPDGAAFSTHHLSTGIG